MDLKILAVAIIFLFLFKNKGKQADNLIDWKKNGDWLILKFKDGSEYQIQNY